MDLVTLAERTAIAAVDGAPVADSGIRVPARALLLVFSYTVTGGPTGVGVRAAVEGSVDGTDWHQLVRFPDQSATGGAKRIARLPGSAAAVEAALAASDLNTASAAVVLADGAQLPMLRAVTKLQTLTGGTAPTVSITVKARPA